MNYTVFFLVVLALLKAATAQADPLIVAGVVDIHDSALPTKHEIHLKRLQARRLVDNENKRLAEEEFRRGTDEMTGHGEQQIRDIQCLKAMDGQVKAGKTQKTLKHQSYEEAVQKYGTADPRSVVAKASWKESQEAMGPLLENQQTLKADVHYGKRRVHNDQTLLRIQKRTMASNARYRAQDDRKMLKEEKSIAEARVAAR